MAPEPKLAAYRTGPASDVPSARPLYTAPDPERFTATTALFFSMPLYQPEIVPSSEQKRDKAGLAPWRTKALLPLNTWPVTGEGPGPDPVGTVTTSGAALPVLS